MTLNPQWELSREKEMTQKNLLFYSESVGGGGKGLF